MPLLSRTEWPYPDILVRLALALALGLLVGLERERAGKEAGLRTFGFVALLGALGGSLGENFSLMVLILMGVLVVFLNIQSLRSNQGTELTTSTAILVTSIAGVLCGQGHRLTPASIIVITTALLAWKQPLAGFSKGLSENEMRSVLVLAILAIVIYPALPTGAIGPWGVIEPRTAWLTVILIAGIGFINYVLWKIYGTRGVEFAGFLGGLVNSTVIVAELIGRIDEGETRKTYAIYRGILLATAAMIVRNVFLLGILAPAAFIFSFPIFLLMLLSCISVMLFNTRFSLSSTAITENQDVRLELPFSLWAVLKYGVIFLVLHVLGVVAEKMSGEPGFYAMTFIGGLVSSASTVAAAASLEAHEGVSSHMAGIGAVIASIMSVFANLPFVLRGINKRLARKLTAAMCLIAIVGIIGALAWPLLLPKLTAHLPTPFQQWLTFNAG